MTCGRGACHSLMNVLSAAKSSCVFSAREAPGFSAPTSAITRPPRVHPERTCPGCGVIFRPGKRERKIKIHCSRACYEASRKVAKTCPACGNDFAVNASIAHRYNVCSNACKTADTIYVNCGRCGQRFRAEKHLNRQFCSEECRRPPVYVTCKTCNADFRTASPALLPPTASSVPAVATASSRARPCWSSASGRRSPCCALTSLPNLT